MADSGDPDPSNKGKGKQMGTIEVPSDSSVSQPPGVDAKWDILGFPIGEYETQVEYREAIMNAVDLEMRELKLKLRDSPSFLDSLQQAHENSVKYNEENIPYLSGLLTSRYQFAVKFLTEHPYLPPQRRAVVETNLGTISASLNELSWRVEVAEKKKFMTKMQATYHVLTREPLQVEYGRERLTVWAPEQSKAKHPSDPKVVEKNRKMLMLTLRAVDAEDRKFPGFVTKDYNWAKKNHNARQSADAWYSNFVQGILKHPEVETFLSSTSNSGGLVVMGSNIQTSDQRTNELSSLLPALCGHFDQVKGSRWTIKHFVGRRTPLEPDANTLLPYKGVAGLLRSICHQLVVRMQVYVNPEILDSWSQESRDRAYDGDVWTLCRLFRDLLIEIAKKGDKTEDYHTILLVVDGMHILELDDARKEFFEMLDFLRAICDECMFGDLGENLRVQYIFLHNGISKVILRPHGRERIVICKTWTSATE